MVDRRWDLAHRIGPGAGRRVRLLARPRRTARPGWPRGTRSTPPARGRRCASGDLAEDWPPTCSTPGSCSCTTTTTAASRCWRPITFGEWVERGHRRAAPDRTPTSPTTAPRCSRRCGHAAGSSCAGSTALPAGLAETAVAAIVAVLIDEEAGDRAARGLRRCADLLGRRRPRSGPRHPGLAAAATTILRAAADALDRTRRARTWPRRWPTRPSAGRPAAAARPTTSRIACGGGADVADLADPPEEVRPVALNDRPRRERSAESRARTPRARRAVRRRRAAPPARPAHVAARVGPRPRRQLRGPVARAGARRRRPPATGPRRPLRRVQAAARRPGGAAAPRSARGAGLRRRGAGRALELLAGADLEPDGPDPLLRHGFVHKWWCSTSTSTTRRCWPPCSCCPLDEGHQLDGAPPPPGRRARRRGEVLVPAGHVRDGHRPPVGLRQRAARATRSICPRSGSTPRRSPTAQYQEFIDAGGYDDERWWSHGGWAWRQEAGLDGPAVLAARRCRLVRGTASAASSRCPPTSRCSTCAGTRPTPTPAGRASGLPTEAEWERAAVGHQPDPTRANLGQRHLGPAPVGAYPAGVSARGLPPDARRRVGVDRHPTSGPTPASWPSPTTSTPPCSTATATRCCGAGRGPPTPAPAAPPSATGTSRSGGRSSPASAAPGTPPDVPPPRLPRARRARWRRSCTSRRSRSSARAGSRSASARAR